MVLLHGTITTGKRILELETAITKQGTEQAALEALFLEFLGQLGQDELKYFQRLEHLKREKWDAFLLFAEKSRPELAAAIDKRKIDEIPTD